MTNAESAKSAEREPVEPPTTIEEAREQVEGLARYLARRSPGYLDDDDAYQAAMLGVCIAWQTYDASRGEFAAYASAHMRFQISEASRLMAAGPTRKRSKRSQAEAKALFESQGGMKVVGLYIDSDNGESFEHSEIVLQQMHAQDELLKLVLTNVDKQHVWQRIEDTLTADEYMTIVLLYAEGWTKEEVARKTIVRRETVWRRQKSALEKLRPIVRSLVEPE